MYSEIWNGFKNEIETINGGKACECKKNFVKIKFNSDDDFSLNKQLKFPTIAIVVKFAFEEDGKYYPQFFLDEYLYEL